jgi:hypothetical protein
MISRATWLSRYWLTQLGLPGMIALGLLTFNLAFYFSALVPVQEKVATMEHDIATMRQHTQSSTKAIREAAATTPQAQLAAFYKSFPGVDGTPDLLQTLYKAAAASKVELDQGAYRLVTEHGNRLHSYQVTLPVKGTYPQIKSFLARAIKDIPTLSLDSISFQRQGIADPTISSEVKLTLYLGGA